MTPHERMVKIYSPKTLEEYKDLCSRHDWYWYMSDMNLSPWPSKRLLELAKENGVEWQKIYNEHHAQCFHNKTFYPDDVEDTYKPPFDL